MLVRVDSLFCALLQWLSFGLQQQVRDPPRRTSLLEFSPLRPWLLLESLLSGSGTCWHTTDEMCTAAAPPVQKRRKTANSAAAAVEHLLSDAKTSGKSASPSRSAACISDTYPAAGAASLRRKRTGTGGRRGPAPAKHTHQELKSPPPLEVPQPVAQRGDVRRQLMQYPSGGAAVRRIDQWVRRRRTAS